MHTAVGALKLFGRWGLVPVKSMVARRACRSIDDAHDDLAAVVDLVVEAPSLSADRAAHVLLGVVLHVLHVRLHHVEAELPAPCGAAPARPSRTRRSAPEVGDVLLRVASRITTRGEQLAHFVLAKAALRDK